MVWMGGEGVKGVARRSRYRIARSHSVLRIIGARVPRTDPAQWLETIRGVQLKILTPLEVRCRNSSWHQDTAL